MLLFEGRFLSIGCGVFGGIADGCAGVVGVVGNSCLCAVGAVWATGGEETTWQFRNGFEVGVGVPADSEETTWQFKS